MTLKLLLVLSVLATLCHSQDTTKCYNNISDFKNSLSSFYGHFNPPDIYLMNLRLFSVKDYLNSTYLSCLNKTLNMSGYLQNQADCLISLQNVSDLAPVYVTPDSDKVKKDLQTIGDVVIRAYTNCIKVFAYWSQYNVSSDCESGAKDLDKVLSDYGDDILLGGNGTKYLNNMLLLADRQRKVCGNPYSFSKPNTQKSDTCKSSNQDWLYYQAQSMDGFISKKNWYYYTINLYFFYQGVARAQSLCNSQLVEL